MRWAFSEYRRSGLNYIFIVILGLVSLTIIATRGSVATLWRLNPVFAAGFGSFVIGTLCISVSFVNRLAAISYRHEIKFLQPYYQSAVIFSMSRYADVFENCGVVFVTLCPNLYMIARLLQGRCPDGTTVWNEQECNPAGGRYIPLDSFIIAVMSILSVQVFVNGASKGAVVLAWAIVVSSVNFCMWLINSDLFVWNNLALAAAVFVSYEFER